jgi:DNA-binding CsgD family transcriptional regulator
VICVINLDTKGGFRGEYAVPFNKLTDLIYDAIVDERAVNHLAKAIAEHFKADANWMLIGANSDMGPAAACIHGLDENIVRAYQEEYYEYDPWFAVTNNAPNNKPSSLERYVSRKDFQYSRVYQDLIRGNADIMHCLGLTFSDNSSVSTFAIQRGKNSRPFDEDDERRIKPYIPHLRRFAWAAARKARMVTQDIEKLSTRPDPIIIVDQNAYPVHCSASGAVLLDSCTVFARSPSGRMYSVDRRLPFEAAVRDAALRGIPTLQHVNPPCGAHFIAIDPCPALKGHVSITIRNQRLHAERKTAEAARRFDLTGAEQRLVISLVSGLTVEEHCVCYSVATSTARSQLRAIFDKTSTQKQSQLIAAILSPPTR